MASVGRLRVLRRSIATSTKSIADSFNAPGVTGLRATIFGAYGFVGRYVTSLIGMGSNAAC